MAKVIVHFTLFFLLSCSSSPEKYRSPSQFLDTSGYVEVDGGYIGHLPSGTIVEGSSNFGGIQPNYLIDSGNDIIQKYIKKARKIGLSGKPFWKKVEKVIELVKLDAITGREYEDPDYLAILNHYRELNKSIPLSEYITCSTGVCREYAFLTHILLKEAGIPNHHVYAKIRRASRYHGYDINENHAFVTVEYKNQIWAIDSYYVGFNGYLLEDLQSRQGITRKSQKAPLARDHIEFRRINKILKYPKAWIPIYSCAQMMRKLLE